MLLSNTDIIPDRKYNILGLANGVGYCHGLARILTSGTISGISQLVHDAECDAVSEMINEAVRVGGDGIIAIRFTSVNLNTVASILASGTIIKFVE